MSKHVYPIDKDTDIPIGVGWVILEFSSVHIPGDERSIENPGHGYPAYDHPLTSVLYYEDATAWESAIKKRLELGQKFVALRVQRPAIKLTMQLDIERYR